MDRYEELRRRVRYSYACAAVERLKVAGDAVSDQELADAMEARDLARIDLDEAARPVTDA